MDKSIYTKEHSRLISMLKKARYAANLSQQDVGKLLNKTQSYVSKIEAGQRRVDVIQLKKFSKIYGKPVTFFTK